MKALLTSQTKKSTTYPWPLFHPSIHPSIHMKRFFDFINPNYSKYGWYELCCHNRYLTQPASQLLMYLLTYLLTHSLCSKELKPAKILLSSTVIRKTPRFIYKKTLLSTVDISYAGRATLLILQYSISYDDDGGGFGKGVVVVVERDMHVRWLR